MSDINTAFCKVVFKNYKDDLRAVVGKAKAKVLLERHMDVCGTARSNYFLHWVKDGELIKEDLYRDDTCDNIWDARAKAISFLLDKLSELHPEIKAVLDKLTDERIAEIEARQGAQ